MMKFDEKKETVAELVLKAAEEEFADKGLFGARVDSICAKSGVNKRIVYKLFKNKEELYKTVLYDAYSKMARAEAEIFKKDYSSCEEAVRRVIRMYFEYMEENPTYVSLILWENLNKGEYVKDVDLSDIKNKVYDYLFRIISEGKEKGEFKKDISESQTILSVMTFTFSYFSNKFTLSKLLQNKVDFGKDLHERIDNVTEMIINYIKK